MDETRDTLILGTAGHIDHGKTSLIRALTGVETDRLPEEKARGITIELGFAPLDLPSGGRLGVVDVPGHEGLVRTMVAGAAGIDLVLLVVAADEGVMPQTREHLAICDLLGLRQGVVALTKCDLADPDVADLAEAEAEELVAETSLAGAPLLRVSATTGQGIDALANALETAAREARARTARRGPPRLWIDRRFEMKGFGPVATGTLTGNALGVGETACLLPGGREARIRGLQSFGEKAERVAPGARCAVNLQGVELAELERGLQISVPGGLVETDVFDAQLAWLPGAPALASDPTAVELLVGTARFRARVAPIGGMGLAAGETGFARIHLDDGRAALLPGDAFIVRGFRHLAGGGATLGGGRVLDVAPPRRRRSDPALLAELELLRDPGPEEAVRVRVERAGFAGIAAATLVPETGLEPAGVAAALEALAKHEAVFVERERAVGASALAVLEERVRTVLSDYHDREPLKPGMPLGALRGALPENVARAVADRVLARLEAAGALELDERWARAADHVPRLSQQAEVVAARLRADAMIAGLEPPTLPEMREATGLDEAPLRDLLAHLERDGSLVRAPGDLWFDAGAVDELRERVVAHLEREGRLQTAHYKDMIGTTRKFAVPLMELFDAEHLTIRRGEERVLRRRPVGDT